MIHFSGISKQHGPQILFRDASFQILPGSRNGLVGPNGAGKTSIFRLMMVKKSLMPEKSPKPAMSFAAIFLRMSAQCPAVRRFRRLYPPRGQ